MVRDDGDATRTTDRRGLLRGTGVASVVAIAGCLGSDGDDPPFDVRFEVNPGNADRVRVVELIAASLEESGYFETEIETYEWNSFIERISDRDYASKGNLPIIGLSGTFNPESYCKALHHSDHRGQCCNPNGIADPELDEMITAARYGIDVVADDERRRERYDEIWTSLAEKRYSSITHFDLRVGVTNATVHGFTAWPFVEGFFSYALYAPQDEQVLWLDESAHPDETELSDLRRGGTLRGAIAANVDSFDPPYSTDATSTMAQEFVFEKLVRCDGEGTLYPWLAKRYERVETREIERTAYEPYMTAVAADETGALETDEQPIVRHPDDDPVVDDEVRVLTPTGAAAAVDDGVFGMQFRYELHEGVEFHNGEELTADHVVRTVERYENSDRSAERFDSLLHASAVDEYTVDLYAQVPDAEAERELPNLYVHSLEGADLAGGELDPRNGTEPIGTGPYVFADFEDDQYVEYEKNENYWLETGGVEQLPWFDGPSAFPDGPVIDEIELTIVPDDATRSGALQNGEVDVTYGLTTETLDDYERSDEYVVDAVEAGGYEFVQYPVGVEPWDDERLRRAVNHLIPRERIVETVLNGWAREAWTDVPQLAHETGTVDHDALEEEIRPYNEYDPDRAAELIEAVLADRD